MIWKSAILLAVMLVGQPWSKDLDSLGVEPDTETSVEELLVSENSVDEATDSTISLTYSGELESVEDDWIYSGNFKITHYCNCSKCCGKWAGGPTASGVMPASNHTIAVDKDVIPLGSEVLINGQIYIAEDTGVSGHTIDIFCDSHSEALNRGMYTTEVKWR